MYIRAYSMFYNKKERFNDTFSLDDLLIVFKIFKIKIVRSFIIHTPIDGHFHLNYTLRGSCVQCERFYYYTYLRFSLSIIASYMVIGLYILFTRGRMKILMQPPTLYFINQEGNKIHFFLYCTIHII